MEVTSDGRVWFADYSRGYLGMYDPAASSFKEWAMPSGANSRPYGMASNGESRVWVVETGVFPNMFVEFPERGQLVVDMLDSMAGKKAPRGGRRPEMSFRLRNYEILLRRPTPEA